jgi:sporulation protein YlmC with PRC-barrel domain
MNTHRTSLLFAALATTATFAVGSAHAQSASPPGATGTSEDGRPSSTRPARANSSADKAQRDASEAWQRTHRASKIIGTEVRNPQGEKVGTVKDLVLDDPGTGRISHLVVGIGGVLGMGDKLFAVPYGEVRTQPGQNYLVLSRANDLAQAFDEQHWPDFRNRTANAGAGTAGSSDAASTYYERSLVHG